ncbi:MAG: C4-type zinc ribbon domain-containing protein [Tepidisphaeraceae bacterium]
MLRQRQQNATNNKEYQTLIVDINTQKADRAKIEEQALAAMETAGKQKQAAIDLKARLEAETAKHGEMASAIDSQVQALTAEAEQFKGPRDEAAVGIAPRTMTIYQKAADRYEGEALAPLQKPKPKVEEYVCAGCNIELVVDVYNRLHSRDESMQCPSCGRLLYIPEDLPPEKAIAKKKAPSKPRTPKEKKPKSKLDAAIAEAKLPQVGDQTLRGERVEAESDKPVVSAYENAEQNAEVASTESSSSAAPTESSEPSSQA